MSDHSADCAGKIESGNTDSTMPVFFTKGIQFGSSGITAPKHKGNADNNLFCNLERMMSPSIRTAEKDAVNDSKRNNRRNKQLVPKLESILYQKKNHFYQYTATVCC